MEDRRYIKEYIQKYRKIQSENKKELKTLMSCRNVDDDNTKLIITNKTKKLQQDIKKYDI